MRYLCVCSGIGAASVAWLPLGWQAAGYSEIEPFPRAVLQQRLAATPVDWDHRYDEKSQAVPLFGDFTKIQAHHVGPVDLLVGGTPCQSFSVAGKRLGLDDPRGNLAVEFLALARRVGARWVVWENVPGALSSWSGDPADGAYDGEGRWAWGETGDFHAFLDLFRECGYRGGYRVLDAQFTRAPGYELAVPQRRRRLFVVGHLGDGRARAVLFERGSMSGNPPPRRRSGQDVAGSLTASAGKRRGNGQADSGILVPSVAGPLAARTTAGGGLGTDMDLAGGLVPDVARPLLATSGSGRRTDLESDTFISVAPTLDASFGRLQGCSGQDLNHGHGHLIPQPIAFGWSDADVTPITGVSPTLRAMGGARPNGGSNLAVAFKASHFTRGKDGAPDETSPALTADADADRGDQDILVGQPIAFTVSQNSNGFAWEDDVHATLDTGARSNVSNTISGVIQAWRVRRLMPVECERLQGLPDGWTQLTNWPGWRDVDSSEDIEELRALGLECRQGKGNKWRVNDPDGPRYRSLGNSMPGNVMRWIGCRIDYVEFAMSKVPA